MNTFKTDIVAEMKPGEVKEIKAEGAEDCCTYNTLAWRYNKLKGKQLGKYIHTSIDYDNSTVWLVCTTYTEYEQEKNRELPKGWWKVKLPKKKSKPLFI